MSSKTLLWHFNLSMESKIYRSYFLSAGDANAEGELSLPVLTNKIIDIATEHANSLGIGNPSMVELHAGWVLSRLTIEMKRYPKVNDSYILSTWIEDFNRHFSIRCFKIESPEREVYGYSRSIWLVMNSIERSNVGLSHLNLPGEMIIGDPAPIARQEKHFPIFPDEIGKKISKKFLSTTHPPFDYRFTFCDLDSYRHVNTVKYIDLLLNQFSLKEHDSFMVNRLELSFLHEAAYGLETKLFRADSDINPLLSSFQLSSATDLSPLLFARILRIKR